MSWTRLAASGFTAAILLFAMSFISWFAYIDIVGFALISIVAPLVWWTVSGPRIPHLFRTLRTPNASTAHVRAATTTARSIRRWIWAVPAYGASLGIISLCTYLDDPAAIGPALAVSILVPLYATIADLFVASPLIASLESRPSPSPVAAVASIPSGAPTMMFSRIVAGALAAFFLVAAILVGSPLGVFIDIVSFLITIVGGGFAWLAMSGAGIGRLRDTLRADAPTQEALAAAQLTVKQGRRAVWLTGIAGTGIGLIQILQNIEDPAAIGPAMAVCLLTLFYALLADLFGFNILRARLANAATPIPEAKKTTHQALEEDLARSLDALRSLEAARSARQ